MQKTGPASCNHCTVYELQIPSLLCTSIFLNTTER